MYKIVPVLDSGARGMGHKPTLVAAFPVGRHDADLLQSVRPRDWRNPVPQGRYNLGVIGAGPAGLVAARGAAAFGAKVALVFGRKRLSRLMIPWCTYTDPEIAHVGLYSFDARQAHIPERTFTILMHEVDRAVTDGMEEGFIKLHVQQNADRILGATVVGRHAGELINSISLAIGSGIGLGALAKVIHSYPTQAVAIRMAAGAYERTQLTPFVRRMAARWLALARR